jgi:hypothetical protein
MQHRSRHSTPALLAALGALTLAYVPLACGVESDILNRSGTGGSGAKGTAGDIGVPTNGNPGMAGTSASGGASSGGASNPAGGTNDIAGSASTAGAAGTAINPLNPHAAEKKTLVADVCDALLKDPCLSYPQADNFNVRTLADTVTFCDQVEQIGAAEIPEACFDAWSADIKCLAQTNHCPCTGNDCILQFPGLRPSRCPAEEDVFEQCVNTMSDNSYGDTSGSARTCHWTTYSGGLCGAFCDGTMDRQFVANCILGAPGGPQQCVCSSGGMLLHDGTPDDVFRTDGGSFLADDCKGIAQKMSDGQCDRILDCCFTWQPVSTDGKPTVEQCDCLSDPTVKGVSTCAEVAALGHGKVVDICPKYDFGTNPVFPTPDAGQ